MNVEEAYANTNWDQFFLKRKMEDPTKNTIESGTFLKQLYMVTMVNQLASSYNNIMNLNYFRYLLYSNFKAEQKTTLH